MMHRASWFDPHGPFTRAVSMLLVSALLVWPAHAADEAAVEPTPAAIAPADAAATSAGEAPVTAVDFVEITAAAQRSIDKGLVYLATTQDADGSWGAPHYGKHVGITALACLAFMAAGHLPGRGEYGPNIEKGLDFILLNCRETGLIAADTSHGPMYGHGYATLFLGEVFGMTGDPRVREALVKAVRLIVNTQNHEGGWRYQPVPVEADLSVTICQVMALRSARNAGIHIPRETIDRAIEYTRQCQAPDGGFRYMLSGGGSAFPRSAAGVATLYYAGIYHDDSVAQGLQYLMRERASLGSQDFGHYYYGHYYAVQAMFQAGGQYWAAWYPEIREELIVKQRDDGSWLSNHGQPYATASALLVMQMPNRLLPIFQR